MEHNLEYLNNCPICKSTAFDKHLELTDHFLSKESFVIIKCQACGFRFTNPRPPKNNISKYYKSEQYISHSNKKTDIFSVIYQIARRLNLQSKYNIIKRHVSRTEKDSLNVLDIGAGTGHFLHFLQKRNWNVFGVEPDANACREAKKQFELNLLPEAALSGLNANSYDVISMWHVLEHVHNLNNRMEEVQNLLKKSGVFILALPNPDSFDAKYYVNLWAAYDVPRHLYHFTKNDVQNLATKHNFSIEKIYTMPLDAFYVSILSEKYRANRLGFFRALLNGIRSNLSYSSKNPNSSSLIYILRTKTA